MIACKPLMRILSPEGSRGKLLVLIFHRVLAQPDPLLPYEPDVAQFEWMVRLIGKNFNVLPFGEAVNLLARRALPSAAACITFDDGYKDNFSMALPILKRHGLVATFFIATGFIDGGRMWNDDVVEAVRVLPDQIVDWSEFGLAQHDLTTHENRLKSLAEILGKMKYFPHAERESTAKTIARCTGVGDMPPKMMSADDIRAMLAAGMELGGHTRSHPILSALCDSDAYAEIIEGKTDLEKILGEPVNVFAYPNGKPQRDFTERHVEMLQDAGFAAAATTESGVGKIETCSLMVPRFTPWDRTQLKFTARCALALAGRT